MLPEQFRMRAQTNQFYDVVHLINPDKQEITLDVALHTSFVFALKHMRIILLRYGLFIDQQLQHLSQSLQFLWLISVPLQVFSVLS